MKKEQEGIFCDIKSIDTKVVFDDFSNHANKRPNTLVVPRIGKGMNFKNKNVIIKKY